MGDDAALLAEAVFLLPLGDPPEDLISSVAARLSRFVELPVRVLAAAAPPPSRVPGRDQLDASTLLEWLEARPSADARVVVGVTAEDIAIPVFTFVFGLARQGGRACVVSLARTEPAFYGLQPDAERRDLRAACEILHELGHLAGLEHCADRGCLMSFAGSIEKVDARGSRFCGRCADRLPRWLVGRHAFAESV